MNESATPCALAGEHHAANASAAITRSLGQPVITAPEARRIMFDYIDARLRTATLTELHATTQIIARALRQAPGQHVLDGSALILRGVHDLVFTEAQLRDQIIETRPHRRLVDDPRE